MNKLYKLEDMVRYELSNKPRTRDDDRYLTLQIYVDYYNINPYAPYADVMTNTKLPSQESIGRCRRKLQETEIALRGSKRKEAIRMAEQVTFIEYAISDRS